MMLIKTVKISGKGQIAIPIDIRKRIGIKSGDELVLMQSKDKIFIEKSSKTASRMKDRFKDITFHSQESLKDVWDNPEDEIWNAYLE